MIYLLVGFWLGLLSVYVGYALSNRIQRSKTDCAPELTDSQIETLLENDEQFMRLTAAIFHSQREAFEEDNA